MSTVFVTVCLLCLGSRLPQYSTTLSAQLIHEHAPSGPWRVAHAVPCCLLAADYDSEWMFTRYVPLSVRLELFRFINFLTL